MPSRRQPLAWAQRSIRDAIRKSEPLSYLVHAARNRMVARTNLKLKATWDEDLADLALLRKQLAGGLPPAPRLQRKALIVGLDRVHFVVFHSILIQALHQEGYQSVVLAGWHEPTIDAYRLLGVRDFVRFTTFFRSVDPAEIDQLMAGIRTLDDALALDRHGISTGKFAAATYMRQQRLGRLNFQSPPVREGFASELTRSCEAADAAERVLNSVKPDLVLVLDRGYTPVGQIYDASMARGIPVLSCNSGHRNNVLVLKRYSQANRTHHPNSLSSDSWRRIREMRWIDPRWKTLEHELDSAYKRGEWFPSAGTSINREVYDTAVMRQRLGLDPAKKTAILFPHIFYDTTFFFGVDLFADFETWYVEAIRAACANDRLNWLVKVHPVNVVKNSREGITAEHSEITAIKREIGKLPDHVKLIPADTDISTLSLFGLMDYCLTVRGTIGIEAACRGITVLTAGTGRYDRRGFTRDFSSREEYLAALARLEDMPGMTARETELARRYAYGLFLCRPLTLTAIDHVYRKDATASLQSSFKVGPGELASAPEVRAIRDWLKSGQEDFLDQGILSEEQDIRTHA